MPRCVEPGGGRARGGASRRRWRNPRPSSRRRPSRRRWRNPSSRRAGGGQAGGGRAGGGGGTRGLPSRRRSSRSAPRRWRNPRPSRSNPGRAGGRPSRRRWRNPRPPSRRRRRSRSSPSRRWRSAEAEELEPPVEAAEPEEPEEPPRHAEEIAFAQQTVLRRCPSSRCASSRCDLRRSLSRPSANRPSTRLEAEVRQLRILLDGALTTTPGATRRRRRVPALTDRGPCRLGHHLPSYLLMVRVGPGTPIQLHHRGLDPDRAQVLAAELWREHPDDAGGTRLVVDIASHRRRYGRVAVFRQPGGDDPRGRGAGARSLRRLCRHCARRLRCGHRRQALGRHRRGALLEFSDALSHVTTLAESVQLLADTVPGVTGCDRAVVYLWDAEASQLAPRAITGGRAWPPRRIPRSCRCSRQRLPPIGVPSPRAARTRPGAGSNGRPPAMPAADARTRSNGTDRIRLDAEVVAIRTDTDEFERVDRPARGRRPRRVDRGPAGEAADGGIRCGGLGRRAVLRRRGVPRGGCGQLRSGHLHRVDARLRPPRAAGRPRGSGAPPPSGTSTSSKRSPTWHGTTPSPGCRTVASSRTGSNRSSCVRAGSASRFACSSSTSTTSRRSTTPSVTRPVTT